SFNNSSSTQSGLRALISVPRWLIFGQLFLPRPLLLVLCQVRPSTCGLLAWLQCLLHWPSSLVTSAKHDFTFASLVLALPPAKSKCGSFILIIIARAASIPCRPALQST